jgi:predicted nucleotidyltransferase
MNSEEFTYKHVVEALTEYNVRHGGTQDIKVKCVYLFGSRLFDTQDENSDYVSNHSLPTAHN